MAPSRGIRYGEGQRCRYEVFYSYRAGGEKRGNVKGTRLARGGTGRQTAIFPGREGRNLAASVCRKRGGDHKKEENRWRNLGREKGTRSLEELYD